MLLSLKSSREGIRKALISVWAEEDGSGTKGVLLSYEQRQ